MVTEQDWHIPYTRDDISLQKALDTIADIRTYQYDIPLMIELADNAELNTANQRLFAGNLDLRQHDCIHILLGRGLLLADEMFTIGFTLASHYKASMREAHFYAYFARKIFSAINHLSDAELSIFRDGVRLGYISGCVALDKFDYEPWLDESLNKLRDAIGIESELLLAYYAVEQSRNPLSLASQRLLAPALQGVAF